MDIYTLVAIKFALGMLVMILQINILGKYEFSLNTPLNQIQNYVLGGIIGGVIYNQTVSVLEFLIILLIWSLVVIITKILRESSSIFKRAVSAAPELLVCAGKVDVARCAKVGLTAEQLSRSLREANISSIEEVGSAIMETNGRLTIQRKEDVRAMCPLPLISDGQIVADGLMLSGKDISWVEQQLQIAGFSSPHDIYLATLEGDTLHLIPYKETFS